MKSTLRILGFLSIGFLLLWYITKDQDSEKIIFELLNANYWWIILSMLVGIISHFFRALRWNLLISSLGYKTKISNTFYSLMTGYVFNIVVPRLGEITRCGILNRSSKVPFSVLFGTVLSERFFDVLCLALLISITVLLQLSFLEAFLGKYIYYPVLNRFENNYLAILIIGVVIVALIIFLYRFLKSRLRKKHPGKKLSWLKIQIKGIVSGVKTIRYMKKKWTFLFYTLMIWLNYFLMVYLCFFAIRGTSHLGFSEGITILSLGSLGIVAPVPGGIGTYHFIVTKVLTELYEISSEFAISYAYIAHASQIIMLLLAGLFSSFMIYFVLKHKNKIKNQNHKFVNKNQTGKHIDT